MKTLYSKNHYKDLTKKDIEKKVREEGFNPIEIKDPPGEEYAMHTHPETKLLAILDGGMCAKIDGKHYILEKGDRIIIPGNVPHSALVDNTGCTFFWSEKLLSK